MDVDDEPNLDIKIHKATNKVLEKIYKSKMDKKIKEAVNITVDENIEPNIKDYDYNITLDESFKKSIETDIIKGKVQALIISCIKPIRIKISFYEIEEIVLYENVAYIGKNYIPLRISSLDFKNEKFNFSPVEWILNNKLRIDIDGQKDISIGLTIRCINA